jgi:O-6-methylguanine DNA methyltransferase
VDEGGVLRSVALPPEPPGEIATEDLAAVLRELEQHPLPPDADGFLGKTYAHMRAIPWGHALTYGELAEKVGSPKAVRAIGQACARNPLPIIVPCHRVLAADGLGGFAYGGAWKAALLAAETSPR